MSKSKTDTDNKEIEGNASYFYCKLFIGLGCATVSIAALSVGLLFGLRDDGGRTFGSPATPEPPTPTPFPEFDYPEYNLYNCTMQLVPNRTLNDFAFCYFDIGNQSNNIRFVLRAGIPTITFVKFGKILSEELHGIKVSLSNIENQCFYNCTSVTCADFNAHKQQLQGKLFGSEFEIVLANIDTTCFIPSISVLRLSGDIHTNESYTLTNALSCSLLGTVFTGLCGH